MNEIAEVNAQMRPVGSLDSQLQTETEKNYQDWLKKDQDRVLAEETSRKNMEFDKVRQLGFITSQDVQKMQESYYKQFLETVNQLKEENTKLREMVFRARATGMNSGAQDSQTTSAADMNTIANKFARPFNAGMRK